MDNDRDAIDVLKCLLHHGWTIYDNGEKIFLPENDNGMFDWKSQVNITDSEIFSILTIKYKAKETLGISLSWLDTNIGGEFLIYPDLSVSLCCSNNRQTNNYNITDFDWYLSKLIPIFIKENFYIESLTFSHYE